MYWQLTHKGDYRCQLLADRHYSREQPGTISFTRPGYNQVLYTQDEFGEAVYVWWRPKFETGEPFTQRMDHLEAIECTIFRNETHILSSILITEACQAVQTWEHYLQCKDGLITSVASNHTTSRRGKHNQPGMCYVHANFQVFPHQVGKADTWLQLLPAQLPAPLSPIIPNKKYTVARPPEVIAAQNQDRAIKQYLKSLR